MSSLKEIKGRIGSVRSTEKITSAMRMVSTAKLRRTQGKATLTLAYVEQLRRIMSSLRSSLTTKELQTVDPRTCPTLQHVTLVAISSSSGLCGAFNSNLWKALEARIQYYREQGVALTIIPLGKKVAHSLKSTKLEAPLGPKGCLERSAEESTASVTGVFPPVQVDATHITDADAFTAQPSAETQQPLIKLIAQLQDDYQQARTDRVEIIYTHFKSMGTQLLTNLQFLPYQGLDAISDNTTTNANSSLGNYIVEPTPLDMYRHTLPLLQQSEFLALLLDAATAEHASRMLAMQTADDNAQDLLQELTLLYNKTRQQSITNELIDIMSGAQR